MNQKSNTLSLYEFQKHSKNSPKSRYIFSSENQDWTSVDDKVRFNLVFQQMVVLRHPDAICFKNGSNLLRFDRVKNIKTSAAIIGTEEIFDVICDGNTKYTIVAR